jgi:hypothetical protein
MVLNFVTAYYWLNNSYCDSNKMGKFRDCEGIGSNHDFSTNRGPDPLTVWYNLYLNWFTLYLNNCDFLS